MELMDYVYNAHFFKKDGLYKYNPIKLNLWISYISPTFAK